MKLLIASDIHGDINSAKKLINVFNSDKYDKLILLGDLLYHGPRNNLPCSYAPKEVIELLNEYKDKILAVRGNCEAEVDQMVLQFPVMADYAVIFDGEITIYATHGHKFDADNPPPMSKNDVLLHGHTHLYKIENFGNNNLVLNPGSISIPKGGNPQSFAVYENRTFSVIDFDGNTLVSKKI